MDPTLEQKLKLLLAYGFTLAARDPRVNAPHPGTVMLVECLDEVIDGGETWALVGDNIAEMVDEAFDFAVSMFDGADRVLADILAGGTGLLPITETP